VVFNHQSRLQAYFVWDTVIFILNGLIFILIGLQLPYILHDVGPRSLGPMLKYGAIISLAAILVRIIWVFPAALIPRALFRSIRERERNYTTRYTTIIAWSGMRGVVSLAAALALPLTLNDKPFPNREAIIFITFCVIFATLVLQGLSLPYIIRVLKIRPDGAPEKEEHEARLRLASSVIEHIESNYSLSLSDGVLNQIKSKYEIRVQRMLKTSNNQKMSDQELAELQRIQKELVQSERKFLLDLRKNRQVSDEVLRKLEYELDLEEERLVLEQGIS
jgi:CPA1 family monovalent cation:H+ antiporter